MRHTWRGAALGGLGNWRSFEGPALFEKFAEEQQGNREDQDEDGNCSAEWPIECRAEEGCTTLAIMMPEGPPTRRGARKSPRDRTKANVAPASKPGMESGRITRRNVCVEPAPRSCEASTSGRGMCSSAA